MARELENQNVVKALILDGRKILFLWDPNIETQDKWEVPGGRKHAGESDEDALAREVLEEAGIQIKIDRFVADWQHSLPERGWVLLGKSYLCTPVTKDVKLEDPEKQHTQFQWVDIDMAKMMDLTPWLARSLDVL